MEKCEETVVLLKYRRNVKVWLCEECETENSMDFMKCVVCGTNRQVNNRVLDVWNGEDATENQIEHVDKRITDDNGRKFTAVIAVIIILALIGLGLFYLNENYYLW